MEVLASPEIFNIISKVPILLRNKGIFNVYSMHII